MKKQGNAWTISAGQVSNLILLFKVVFLTNLTGYVLLGGIIPIQHWRIAMGVLILKHLIVYWQTLPIPLNVINAPKTVFWTLPTMSVYHSNRAVKFLTDITRDVKNVDLHTRWNKWMEPAIAKNHKNRLQILKDHKILQEHQHKYLYPKIKSIPNRLLLR